jgi:outer membrane immunogenic protein
MTHALPSTGRKVPASRPRRGSTSEEHLMKRLVLGAIASVLLFSPVYAADLPAIPPVLKAPVAVNVPNFNWSGIYVGGNAGYGAQPTQSSNGVSGTGGDAIFAGLAPANISNSPRGPMVGGQIGYRYQNGAFVFGIEEQLDWANITNQSSTGSTVPGLSGSSQIGQSIDWISFSNLTLGLSPASHWMAYATGGLAVGGVKTNSSAAVSADGTTLAGSQSIDQTRVGWDAGFGVEFAVNSNWTVRADAKYYDLGTPSGAFSTNGATGVAPLSINFSDPTKGYIGTLGLNYKFN